MRLVTNGQRGYDEAAAMYDELFPSGYASDVERSALALFADQVRSRNLDGPVLDVGCGAGHIARDLAQRGHSVIGLDPSAQMLALARSYYPRLIWLEDDARLVRLPDATPPLAAVVARFSLIHVDPADLDDVLAGWHRRLQPGGLVLTAFQCTDDSGAPVVEFDHKVARAWRWNPDAMSDTLVHTGFAERWRLLTRPDSTHRFPECHLVHERPDRG